MRGDAPGPPRGSQGVLMWVIKSFSNNPFGTAAVSNMGRDDCSTNRKVAREAVGGTYSKDMG